MKEGSNFVFENVGLMYYSLHKISLNRGRSYTKPPSWIKNKRATTNPKSKDNKCLRHATTAALNHEKIKNHPERISNLESLFDQCNWKDIEFPSHSKDWKNLNKTIKQLPLKSYLYHIILNK